MIKLLILPLLMFPYVNNVAWNPNTNWYSEDRERIQNFDFDLEYGYVPYDMGSYYELSMSEQTSYFIKGGVTFPNSINTTNKTNVSYYLSNQPLWAQYEGYNNLPPPNHFESLAGEPLNYYVTILFSTMSSVYDIPKLNSYIRLQLYYPNLIDKFYPPGRNLYDYVDVVGEIKFNSSNNHHYLSFDIYFFDNENITYTAHTEPIDFRYINNHNFLNSDGNENFDSNTLQLFGSSDYDFNLFNDRYYNPRDSFENFYDSGYENGYDSGYQDGFNQVGLDNWLVSLFGGMGALLNIQILPNLTIGSIIMIFLAIPLTYAIIKLMKGGGD